jgi:hypothetical protein
MKEMDLYPLLLCPHYHKEKGRVKSLQQMMKKTRGMAIALDKCSALEIVGAPIEYLHLTENPRRIKYIGRNQSIIKMRFP